MKIEIERKFLLKKPPPDESLKDSTYIVQGYLCYDPAVRVRISVRDQVTSAKLTIKGSGNISREEFEYDVPHLEATRMLTGLPSGRSTQGDICASKIVKYRYQIGRWEVDYFPSFEFWLAEIELESEDEKFEKPEWLGEEVTFDPAYSNVALSRFGPPVKMMK